MSYDYTQLLSDIPTWLNNNSAELVGALPTIILSAQERVWRDLDLRAFDYERTANCTAGSPTIPKPDDLLVPRYLALMVPTGAGGERRSMLPIKTAEYLMEFAPDDSITGTPQYYAIEDADNYRLAPVPDQAYGYKMGYKRRPTPLSALAPTNWLTDKAYDCLLAACLADAARFVLDDRQNTLIQVWEAKYSGLVHDINGQEQNKSRDSFRVPTAYTENRAAGGQ